MEVNVIPIKRSPCHSPLPRKKNNRAKSALNIYESHTKPIEFDRGSLPDLKQTRSISQIIRLNPDRYLYGSTTSLNTNSSSSKGEVVSAVLDWLDNISIASSDSNLSQSSAKSKSRKKEDKLSRKRGNPSH